MEIYSGPFIVICIVLGLLVAFALYRSSRYPQKHSAEPEERNREELLRRANGIDRKDHWSD